MAETKIYIVFILVVIAVASAGWLSTFAEEFDGQTKLNTNRFTPTYHFTPTVINDELQFYYPDAFTFGPSYLRILGEKRTLNGFQYTSGVMTTKDRWSQTFGYFEWRARMPVGRGLWPGFWLLPQDTASGKQDTILNRCTKSKHKVKCSCPA
jgi:beta-glucanase (GH16 family)